MTAKDEKVSDEVDPDQSSTALSTSTKRKSTVDEIEVNLEAPEPPSKRAKRALKKGKALTKKKNDSDNDDDLTRDEQGEGQGGPKGEKAVRSEHGVWIGNLPFAVTAPQLRKWLIDNSGGVITEESITRLKIPTVKEKGQGKNSAAPANRGFAYVDFADIGSKVAAIALSETDLGARKMLIKDSKSFEGRPKKEPDTAAANKNNDDTLKTNDSGSRKIFVGNLSFKTTEDDLRRNFEKCGEIEFIKVATFEDTGKCKGFAWVRFKEPEAAAWAVKGFVKIKEAVETEDDFKVEGNSSESDDDEKPKQQRKFKTRKWWVNRMLGRELKLELAEDDQARYRKRFGKDAPNGAPNRAAGNDGKKHGRRTDRQEQSGESHGADGEGKALKGAEDIQVARLTGAVVKPAGTKVTFDD